MALGRVTPALAFGILLVYERRDTYSRARARARARTAVRARYISRDAETIGFMVYSYGIGARYGVRVGIVK